MSALNPGSFDVKAFLARAGTRPTPVHSEPQQLFFKQGSAANGVFYLQSGRARLTVAAKSKKEATVMLLVPGDFFGEESLAGAEELYLASATSITPCTTLRIDRSEMVIAMHENHAFSVAFVKFLLGRSMRVQADLVDQLFNSTERRLARALLTIAANDQPDQPEVLLPKITQETLADLIGATRSQVNHFMTRFRAQGLIEYKSRIRVNRLLLTSILAD